jgi:PII-like signaling protein
MPTPRPGKRLTVIIGENDRWQHKRLCDEIVRRAREAGLAGATVERGIEGYGRAGHLHTSRILDLSQDLPLAIVIVDSAERVEAFLPELEGLIPEGMVVLDDVEVIRYGPREGEGAG